MSKEEEKRIEFKSKKRIIDKFDEVLQEAGYNRAEVFTRFMNKVIENPAEARIENALAESKIK
jgi:hypothetical protein